MKHTNSGQRTDKKVKDTHVSGIIGIVKKYKYAVLVILAGVLLMLLPKCQATDKESESTTFNEESFSVAEQESKMADALSHISGVGKIQVVLTLKSGTELHLAEDEQSDEDQTKTETVTINRGSGQQDIVVTKRVYPTYQGALIVCEGAGNSAVKLAVTSAVGALTGLSSEKISVVPWNS
jgi:stage III sporulation protein AG